MCWGVREDRPDALEDHPLHVGVDIGADLLRTPGPQDAAVGAGVSSFVLERREDRRGGPGEGVVRQVRRWRTVAQTQDAEPLPHHVQQQVALVLVVRVQRGLVDHGLPTDPCDRHRLP